MTDFMKQIDREVKDDRELARLVGQEELILDVTELILEKMEEKGLSKSQLANMLGTNKSHVTQLLRGSRNMTLRTISDIFFGLDCKVVFDVVVEDKWDREFLRMESKMLADSGQAEDWKPREQPQDCTYTGSALEAIAA
ncbi:MAG: helix-turn-helix transcriptional regulator [Phycisphaerae bacterium]|nr:helix-turn-helix transcriptional regulator [Phycisphaerae bacterium]